VYCLNENDKKYRIVEYGKSYDAKSVDGSTLLRVAMTVTSITRAQVEATSRPLVADVAFLSP